MGSPTLDRALLLLLCLLVPLHLLSLGFHVLHSSTDRRFRTIRSMLFLLLLPVLLSAIFVLPDPETPPKMDGVISELEEMKLKITQLESILEENTGNLNSKTLRLEENNKLIEEMGHKVQFLQNALQDIKRSPGGSPYSEERVNALEDEVRLLWAESRKNNFNLHILESKSYDAEEKLEAATSEVAKMENIVTEQWIQIRQLEQALQITKKMTSKVHKKRKPTKCTMFKFVKGVRRHYLLEAVGLPDSFFMGNSISYISQAFEQFKRIMSAAQRCHHELQYLVKEAMERNEFTSPFANEEFIFLVASAIVTFPIIGAWALCSSCFGEPE